MKQRPWITALRKLGACDESIAWAEASPHATLQAAWAACERADWMLWMLDNMYPDVPGPVRLVACACARTSLRYVPAGEERPRLAIECAERYARGQATVAELDAARDAAWAAAWNAAWDAAMAAARAAAGAAAWAAAWAAAGAAAWDAAGAAARAAARDAALSEMAGAIRRMIPDPERLPRVGDM